jgi:hypothetical protein
MAHKPLAGSELNASTKKLQRSGIFVVRFANNPKPRQGRHIPDRSPTMSLLTELGIFFAWLLQICRAYGAVNQKSPTLDFPTRIPHIRRENNPA